jgi:predicted methyltransferase
VLSRLAELSGEELRGGGEGDVAVPAVPGAAFEVVQAQGGPQFAAVVFDPPRLLDAV